MLSRIVDDVISQSAKPRKARHVTLNRWFEIGIGARTGSAFGDTVSVSQARTAPAIDFECSLFRASSSRLTGPRVPQKPLPELRQMRSEPTVGLLRKSTVYGLNGLRPIRGRVEIMEHDQPHQESSPAASQIWNSALTKPSKLASSSEQ